MDAKIGRMVADMADFENGAKVRGWIDVRPYAPRDALDSVAGTRWIAYLHAHTPPSTEFPGGNEYRVAVVRDENAVVNKATQPDVFLTMSEAETFANNQLGEFVAHIESQL